MTYNVFSGTLNTTHVLTHLPVATIDTGRKEGAAVPLSNGGGFP